MSTSFRAGGIHWSATLQSDEFVEGARRIREASTNMRADLQRLTKFDAGGFVRGALQRSSEMYELQKKLKQIARDNSLDHLQKAQMSAPFRERRDEMVANMKAADELQRERLGQAVLGLARYESFSSKAIAANSKLGLSFKQVNSELKALFGRGSDFKEFMELVSGAGAIAGLGLLSSAVARLGDSFKEASADFKAGRKDFQGVIADFFQSIPILGGFIRGGAGIIGSLDTGQGSIFDRHKQLADAQAANTAYLEMMKSMQAAERAARGPRAALREDRNAKLSLLSQMSLTGGIGPRQFELGRDQVQREYERSLNELRRPHKSDFWQRVGAEIRDTITDQARAIRDDFDIGLMRAKSILEDAKALADFQQAVREMVESGQLDADEEIRQANKRMQDEIEDARRDRQDRIIEGARGFFDQDANDVRFAAALVAGSQAEIAARHRATFGPQVAREDEKQQAKKALEAQQKTADRAERIERLLRETAKQLGVADFN